MHTKACVCWNTKSLLAIASVWVNIVNLQQTSALFSLQVLAQERAPLSLVSWLGGLGRRNALVSLQPSWPVDKPGSLSVSFSPFISPQREVSFHLSPPSPSSEKYQTSGRIFWCLLWCSVSTVRGRHSIKSPRWRLLSPHSLCFYSTSSLKLSLSSLQGQRSTCSCGCVISNWGPLLWTNIHLPG